ncbi:thiamine pyrophosphate enzyme, N-terminal TPP binding domain-domain-containing protein [Clohesyomyces aquaticus]|uniref:2-hydroxyacyl-CoA lyase n=1 Tax=Clohesyomyces aquaticus TaxID=1231657 RepID=A0A1Y1ZFY1_9PLEO|nr:thiamine pyrophosphate enzyme, N-terminal TPP binding domain-domain-containing protein [Clohesyomyces aquaticus]
MTAIEVTRPTGAKIIAQALQQLGVKVIFGLVGIPVVQIAEEAIALGIRFIAFRNEQACSYAATAYGYLIGRPGVCLVVGGPGVLHAMAGIGNSSINAFPMLLLAGSCETHLVTKGAFQELDAISLLTPHVKVAVRPSLDSIPQSITHAYRNAWYGRPGTGFVDLPADVIQGKPEDAAETRIVPAAPRAGIDPERLAQVGTLIRSAKAPLVVVGKGAAYARSESVIRKLVEETGIPFLPTPMGKGVLPDAHYLNTSSARSAALKGADVVLVLGARINWILHFGDEPKWAPNVKLIQVDISAEEIGKNNGDAELGIVGDINVVVPQLVTALEGFKYDSTSPYMQALQASKTKNEANAAKIAKIVKSPMGYHQVFDTIKRTLNRLSPPEDGNVVYLSEGANTMDISRSVFNVEHPRLRMDAGTHATMGVGLGYAIAAHAAYNHPEPEGRTGPYTLSKKIVCLEGDSAFGFSMPEVETMARYNMDVLIFVVNNGGIYHGDSEEEEQWLKLQDKTSRGELGGLRSTSLGWEVRYEKMAEMCGGKGFLVRTSEELEKATEEGFHARVPVVVNVIIESGSSKKLEFAWQKNNAKK